VLGQSLLEVRQFLGAQRDLGADEATEHLADDGLGELDVFSAVGTVGGEEQTLVEALPAEHVTAQSQRGRDHGLQTNGTVQFFLAGPRQCLLEVALEI
jgi:hypothetical protein